MSSKLNKRKKSASSITKADVDFYKMSLLFFALCGLVLFILKISSTLTQRQLTGKNVAYELNLLFNNKVYIVVVGILFLASFVYFIINRIKHVNEKFRVFSSINLLVIMLYVIFFSLFFGVKVVNRTDDCMIVLAVTVVLGLLYYISRIYRPDFLIYSIENAILAILLYRYSYIYTVSGIVGKLLLIVAFLAVGIACIIYLGKRKSRVNRDNEKKLTLFPYFISLALWSVFMFIKLPNPTGLPLINLSSMLTILLVQYIIFAIIYTVNLIRE